jgi:OCT family organic anion transporter-like MFS transporter 7
VASTFYGISFNITGFGLNIYLTQFVYGAIELPAKLSAYYLLDKVGRRNTEVGSLLGAGICLAINIFIPRGECFFLLIRKVSNSGPEGSIIFYNLGGLSSEC